VQLLLLNYNEIGFLNDTREYSTALSDPLLPKCMMTLGGSPKLVPVGPTKILIRAWYVYFDYMQT